MPLSEFETNWPIQWPESAVRRASQAVSRLVEAWQLSCLQPMAGSTCSMVYSCVLMGHQVVLKVPVIAEETESGYWALLAFQSHGGVPILRHDDDARAVLMPRLHEGLDELSEEQARVIWTQVMNRLRMAPHFAATPLADWYPPSPPSSLSCQQQETAVRLRDEMLRTCPNEVLLHGDLHHFNILSDGSDWLAIDPKGVRGDPHWECAAFLRNPRGALPKGAELQSLLQDRIQFFAESLELEAARILAWATVDAAFDGNFDLLDALTALI